MKEPDLFGDAPAGGGAGRSPGAWAEPGRPAHVPGAEAPLAARVRPRALEEFQGQEHLLGPGRPLSLMLGGGPPSSMILWGPPGSGKTTLARLLAERSDAAFVPFSAATEGIARVREVVAEAKDRLRATRRRTILFCDEIHRFNKAQQDAFLPHVEDGTIILVGATTENPSFEVVRPLLSRAPVFVLEPLSEVDLELIVAHAALADRGLGNLDLEVTPEARSFMARSADGDARRALGVLETAARLVGRGGTVDLDVAKDALQHRHAVYDKGGEEHYNLISALHKAVRGSDPDGALYWLARMTLGGEDLLYIARRLVRMAVEDIGLADPQALVVANAAKDAYHFLGTPEGELALAEAAVYLATAPKSNRVYSAWKAAAERARATAGEAVPLHLRNAPTELMRQLRYGEDYRYDPEEPHGVAGQSYLPPRLEGERFYTPGAQGYETTLAERLAWWEEKRREARSSRKGSGGGPAEGGGGAGSGPGGAGAGTPG